MFELRVIYQKLRDVVVATSVGIERYNYYLKKLANAKPLVRERVALYAAAVDLTGGEGITVDSYIYRHAQPLVGKPHGVIIVPLNTLLSGKIITPDHLIKKAEKISAHWGDPRIFVRGNTWYLGDFAITITDDDGTYFEDVGGAHRRFNNLLVACHNYGSEYEVEEIARLDSTSSFYCWLSLYMPYARHGGARLLDLHSFISRIPMDGREDAVGYEHAETAGFSKMLWKTVLWVPEEVPTTGRKGDYLPTSFRCEDLVFPLHKMGYAPLVKGGLDFLPIDLVAHRVQPEAHNGKTLCVLSSKPSKSAKRLTMAWGVVSKLASEETKKFRHVWHDFAVGMLTTAAILPSHVDAPGIGWDLGSGLVITNPKWFTVYRGSVYAKGVEVRDLVGTFEGVIELDNAWYAIKSNRAVRRGEPIAWVAGDGYQIPIKAPTSGTLDLIRWRLDEKYRDVGDKTQNLIVEVCVIETSTAWKARSGAYKSMMVNKPSRIITTPHNAQVVFTKDTIKCFDSVVDFLDVIAETFGRMPEGSVYREALRRANELAGYDGDDFLVFDPGVAVAGGYGELLALFDDWKQPVTTKQEICVDSADFVRRFLDLHVQYSGWVKDGDRWSKGDVTVELVAEDGKLWLVQTALGYLSTEQKPLYMAQKAEYSPVADCVGVGNILPTVLIELGENGRKLFTKYAGDVVAFCRAMLACKRGDAAGGEQAVLNRESCLGLTPSELFEFACEVGDYITVGGRQYPIRMIKKYLGGYAYGAEYTLARVLGDYLFIDLWDETDEKDSKLSKLAQNAERLLRSLTEDAERSEDGKVTYERLKKMVLCSVPAVNTKTVADPKIPMNEVWIRYSTDERSVYQTLLKAYGEIPGTVGIYRAPMIHCGFYKLVVVHDGVGEFVAAMSWMAAYYDQGDHDGDGRTLFNADGLDVELASLEDVLAFVESSLGVNLLSLEGLMNGPKDLFVDHFEWLTNEQINKKRGIKPKNFVTDGEFAEFNYGSYRVFSKGVPKSYNLCNLPLFIRDLAQGAGLNDLSEVPAEHFYSAQAFYEKALGGWSPEIQAIFEWFDSNGTDAAGQQALKKEGIQLSHAESWLTFMNLAKMAQAIDRGQEVKASPEQKALLSTAWVAFSMFRSDAKPNKAKIKMDLSKNTSLVALMVRMAESILNFNDDDEKLITTKVESEKVTVAVAALNADQQRLIDLVLAGYSVDFNGRAGTGKTFTLNQLIGVAKASGYRVHVCAPTGQAALLYEGGTTCSRLFGYGARADEIEIGSAEFFKVVLSVRSKFVGKVLIIIDEKSMLSSSELRLAYEIVKAAGGKCQWVLAGDYGQFPPVDGDYAFKGCVRHGVEYAPVPKEMGMVVHTLSKVLRQKDQVFQEALDWAYWGIALHPALKARLVKAPEGAERYFYNNINVMAENRRYVEEYLKANPNAAVKVYRAVTEGVDVNEFLPVTPEMTVAVGMTFTITKNVVVNGVIKVANGEQVKVVGLRHSAIEVEKANGVRVAIEPVPFEVDGTGKFIQLPGYVGPALSLYKCQGKTLDKPSVFEMWREGEQGRLPLRLRNAVYVAASRVTKLDYLYFGGTEELLIKSFGADPEVVRYLLGGKRPLFKVAGKFVYRVLGKEDGWYLLRQSNIENGKYLDMRSDGRKLHALVNSEWIEVEMDQSFVYLIKVYNEDWGDNGGASNGRNLS